MNDDEITALDARAILGQLAALPVVESEAHAAMRAFADSIAADLQLRQAVAVARYIADMAHWPPLEPWELLGWTRRRWVRARKRWNANRRMSVTWIATRRPNTITDPAETAAEDERVHAALKSAGRDWRSVPVPADMIVGKRLPAWRTWLALHAPTRPEMPTRLRLVRREPRPA